jgi:proton glutamate symport protein
MARTGCNLIGNCVAAVGIARWEDQLPEETLEIGYLQSYSN